MQVLDLLLSAGFDQSDHRLASVFQVARVTPIAMQQFSEAAVFGNFHNNLLIAICNRGKRTASWTASFETIRIQMLDVGKSFEHSIDAPEGLKGSIKTLPGTPMSDHFQSELGHGLQVCAMMQVSQTGFLLHSIASQVEHHLDSKYGS